METQPPKIRGQKNTFWTNLDVWTGMSWNQGPFFQIVAFFRALDWNPALFFQILAFSWEATRRMEKMMYFSAAPKRGAETSSDTVQNPKQFFQVSIEVLQTFPPERLHLCNILESKTGQRLPHWTKTFLGGLCAKRDRFNLASLSRPNLSASTATFSAIIPGQAWAHRVAERQQINGGENCNQEGAHGNMQFEGFYEHRSRKLGTCEENLDVGRGHAPWQWKTADDSLFGECQWQPFSTVSRDLVLVATSPSLPSLKDMESNGKSEE